MRTVHNAHFLASFNPQQQTLISERASASFSDYLTLCKPRIVLLMLITSSVGMLLASVHTVPWLALLVGNTGIALCAFAAAAVNHVVDYRLDAKMLRTRQRPVAAGKVSPPNALLMAAVLGVAGFSCLHVFINPLTAWLTLLALLGYAVIYTAFLKRATTQNIVIGGLAGAMPPLLGWVAVTGAMAPQAWLLVLIIFLWTPPHFWALALARDAEYRLIDLPMLSVVYGREVTGLHAFVYSLLLALTCMLPVAIGMSGLLYAVAAALLNLYFVCRCWQMWKRFSERLAMRVFWDSINYLFAIFIALLLDHALTLAGWNLIITPGGLI